jgi:hypothetical protein
LEINSLHNFIKTYLKMKFKILTAALLLIMALTAKAQGGGGRGGDPIQRAEMQSKTMVDSLLLSTKQAEKVKEINLKYANKQKEARSANADGDWEKMRTSMDALRTEQNAELKTVLTQEQYDHWQKIAAEQWKNRGAGGYERPSQNGSDDKAPGEKKEKSKGKKGNPAPPPPPPPPAPIPEGGNG